MEQENDSKIKGFVIQPRIPFQHFIDKVLFQHLVEEANYIPSERCGVGQTIIVLSVLEKESCWTRRKIKWSLSRLEKKGIIQCVTLPQKRGILVTIPNYSEYQNLENYRKNVQENVQEVVQERVQEDEHEADYANHSRARDRLHLKQGNVQENVQEIAQENEHEHEHTITSLITSLNNINNIKHIKDFLENAPVKSLNLSSFEDIKIFVDFAEQINPIDANRKTIYQYFDCIRLTRGTCKISANILANLWEKFKKYDVDQLHYAMIKHCIDHDDKNEKYTLGILRNTDIHEARRKLMIIKNKNPREEVTHAINNRSINQEKYGF